MRKWLILLSALSASSASSAPAWTWVDAEGQVHFSDRPVPGARQVQLSGAQGFGTATPATAPAPTAGPATGTPAAPYQTIEIMTPAENEMLWNIGANLNVIVRFQPALQPGHSFDVALDGQRRNATTTSGRLSLPNVFRGTHTLQVIVLDGSGAELMRSPVRNFVVQQTSTQNPNNPNVRPPARPQSGAN